MDSRQRLNLLKALCFVFLWVLVSCSDDTEREEKAPAQTSVDPTPYLGRYNLTPSAIGETLVLFRDGRVAYRSETTERSGKWGLDPVMLRIYLGENDAGSGTLQQPAGPTGVFLLDSFHRQNWRGLWNGEVRFLKK